MMKDKDKLSIDLIKYKDCLSGKVIKSGLVEKARIYEDHIRRLGERQIVLDETIRKQKYIIDNLSKRLARNAVAIKEQTSAGWIAWAEKYYDSEEDLV